MGGKGADTRPMQIQVLPCIGRLDTGKIVSACRLHERKTQLWGNGGCLSTPCLKSTQVSLSLHVSGASRVTRAQGECL